MKRDLQRIGVLSGGLSGERELSLRAGTAVYEALAARGHEVTQIFVDRDLDLALRATPIDLAFLALRGRYGEDGCVQGLLELAGIPYTGSSVLSSALAMDKLKAKELFRLHNLPTPSYYVHRGGGDDALEQHGAFGFPVVVKPRAASSCLGVRRVDGPAELESAVEAALRFDDHVLVERCVEGRELHVLILGGRVLGVAELGGRGIDVASCPPATCLSPRLSMERRRGAVELALRAARALETSGLVEVDLVLTERGNEYLLEVDTQPPLLPGGVAARIARAGGMELPDLVEAVLAEAGLHASRRPERVPGDRRLGELPWRELDRRPQLESH